ncbi:MAG: hypothetical protein FWC92_05390 [Defluviitaleaceae bacterium]|nr:hypothetical protein [Defluviitaleaceae bacterium]
MTAKRGIIKALLVDLVAFLFIFAVVVYLYQTTVGNISVIYLLLVVPFSLLSLLRFVISKSRVLFLFSHVIIIAISLIPDIEIHTRVIIVGFIAVSVMYSITTKFKDQWKLPFGVVFFGIFVNLAFFGLLTINDSGSTVTTVYYHVSTLLIFLAVVIHVHITNLDFNLVVNGHHSRRHVGSLIANNIKLLLVFAVVLAVGGAVAVFTPIGALLMVATGRVFWVLFMIVAIIGTFFVWLFSHINWNPPFGMTDDGSEPPDLLTLEEIHDAFMVTPREGYTIEIVLAAIGVIILLVYLYMKFSHKFEKREKPIRVLKEQTYSISNEKITMSGFSNLIPRFRRLVRHPVRRAYIKKVKSHIKRGVQVMPHDTPDQIAEKIHHKEDIGELTIRYEKVRYGRD